MKPKPISYCSKQGDYWYGWEDFSRPKTIYSIRFDDGSVFDMVNGWRETELSPRICPACGQKRNDVV